MPAQIVIIENDAAHRQLFRYLFEHWGHAVAAVATGHAALAQLGQTTSIHCVARIFAALAASGPFSDFSQHRQFSRSRGTIGGRSGPFSRQIARSKS